MIFGAKSIEFSYAHTKRGISRVERFKDNIGDIKKIERHFIEQLHQLKRFHVPEDRMLAVACRAFEWDIKKTDLKTPQRLMQLQQTKKLVTELTEKYFTEMGPHGYAALNVLTDFASRPKGVISIEASINGFQQKATDWMEDFISQISKPTFTFDKYIGNFQTSADTLATIEA